MLELHLRGDPSHIVSTARALSIPSASAQPSKPLPRTREQDCTHSRQDHDAMKRLETNTVRIEVEGTHRYATPLLCKRDMPLLRSSGAWRGSSLETPRVQRPTVLKSRNYSYQGRWRSPRRDLQMKVNRGSFHTTMLRIGSYSIAPFSQVELA
ncbi:hypothetical protein MHYP_G00061250 [Metynnis hypsauchen]